MTDNNPLVSLITPVFNAEAVLPRMLDSVANQTLVDYEHILVDDGSVDTSLDIIALKAKSDSRIRLYSQPNAGASAARNRGLAEARGTWILFLDADDSIARSHLADMVKAGCTGTDAVCSGFLRLYPDGRVQSRRQPPRLVNGRFADVSSRPPVVIHAILIRRTLLARVGNFDEGLRTNEDWDLWVRLHRSGCRIDSIRANSAHYWMSPGSLTANGSQIAQDTATVLSRMIAPDRRVADPSLAVAAQSEIAEQSLLRCGFWAIGVEAAAGRDAEPVIAQMPEGRVPQVQCHDLTSALFEGLTIGGLLPFERLHELWPDIEQPLSEAMEKLARRLGNQDLSRTWLRSLEREVIRVTHVAQPIRIGSSLAIPAGLFGPVTQWPAADDHVYQRILKIKYLRPRSWAVIEWRHASRPTVLEFWKTVVHDWAQRCRLRITRRAGS